MLLLTQCLMLGGSVLAAVVRLCDSWVYLITHSACQAQHSVLTAACVNVTQWSVGYAGGAGQQQLLTVGGAPVILSMFLCHRKVAAGSGRLHEQQANFPVTGRLCRLWQVSLPATCVCAAHCAGRAAAARGTLLCDTGLLLPLVAADCGRIMRMLPLPDCACGCEAGRGGH
jgi:hypothetical protein